MSLLKDRNLTSEQLKLTCAAINTFGEGGHPVATLDSAPFFRVPYARKCLELAQVFILPSHPGHKRVGEILEALA